MKTWVAIIRVETRIETCMETRKETCMETRLETWIETRMETCMETWLEIWGRPAWRLGNNSDEDSDRNLEDDSLLYIFR